MKRFHLASMALSNGRKSQKASAVKPVGVSAGWVLLCRQGWTLLSRGTAPQLLLAFGQQQLLDKEHPFPQRVLVQVPSPAASPALSLAATVTKSKLGKAGKASHGCTSRAEPQVVFLWPRDYASCTRTVAGLRSLGSTCPHLLLWGASSKAIREFTDFLLLQANGQEREGERE